MVASDDENTLLAYKFKKEFRAPKGAPGEAKEAYGKDATDITIIVPVGTIVRHGDTGEILHQFSKDKEEFIVARGGTGGTGNMHFANPVNQFPQFAFLGEPGREFFVDLELSLMGDVALIGTPSVGKSTIINAVAHTKAKVADYPFTTLIPHLGEVNLGGRRFCIMDVPGLIEGASEGKGLGTDFLRHILKATVFSFVCDLSRFESGMDDFATLLKELIIFVEERFDGSTEYGDEIEQVRVRIVPEDGFVVFRVEGFMAEERKPLMDKVINRVLSKEDLVQDAEIIGEYKKTLNQAIIKAFKIYGAKLDAKTIDANTQTVSAATHQGLQEWLYWCKNALDHRRYQAPLAMVEPVILYEDGEYTLVQQKVFIDVAKDKIKELFHMSLLDRVEEKAKAVPTKIFAVTDTTICKLVYMTMWDKEAGEHRFRQTLEREGTMAILRNAGMQVGDILRIQSPYEGTPDRYLKW